MPQPKKSRKTKTTAHHHTEVLWTTTQSHYTTALEYHRKHEWISAYYNMQLAALACKHYCSLCGISVEMHSQGKAQSTAPYTLHSPPPLDMHHPVDTLHHLYALMPHYERKIHKFQRAFGCPRAPKSKSSAQDTTTTDCSNISSVDLQADESPVYFEDLIGNEQAKQAIEDGLMHPIFLPSLYPNQAKAMLFYGPPGTGKTLLARATAFELNRREALRVLFFAPTADQFKGKYVGETEEKIVQLFHCASQQATDKQNELHSDPKTKHTTVKSVIFIDEVDSLARRRDGQTGASAGVVASATNTLLQVMDGIQSYDNVIVLAATNYPWNIDNAVLRRFGQKIFVPLPGEDDIVQLMQQSILQHVKRSLQIAPGSETHKRSIKEQFHRWQLLHGIQEDELRVLASAMCGDTTTVGYSPRDIVRLCDHVFKTEASEALYTGMFHQVTLLSSRKTHSNHTHMLEEILQSLKSKHVSSHTFTRLTELLSYAIDVDTPPVLSDTSTFPKSITRTPLLLEHSTQKTEYVEWNLLPKDTIAPPDPSLCKTLHLYIEQQNPLQYLLHRSYKVHARNQNHYVPVFFHGHFPKPNRDPPKDAQSYFKHIHHLVFIYDGRVYEVHQRQQPLALQMALCMDEQKDVLFIDTSASWLRQCVDKLSTMVPHSPRTKPTPKHKALNGSKDVDTGTHTNTENISTPSPTQNKLNINRVAQLLMRKFVYKTTSTLKDITTLYTYDYADAFVSSTNTKTKNLQCVHLTYNRQSFLDAFATVLPSARLSNVKALNVYHRTGKEP